ncbi:MAG TPA: hypothetical protein VHJ83_01660, partial [Micromonosporaceae bacterium]|nr:hypothetical protein [Micromonosporaceae bacterium]
MTHDVGELRRDLARHAEQPEFRLSVEGVRRRARQRRIHRTLAVTGVAAALVVLTVINLLFLPGPGHEVPTADQSGDVELPPPDSGWRRVDDPIRTGIGSGDGTEIVLWFERRDNDVTRLNSGKRDPRTGRVSPWDRVGGSGSDRGLADQAPGGGGLYVPPGRWSLIPLRAQTGNGIWGLYVGEAVRIDIATSGQPRRAQLARLSEDPRFIAFWVNGVTCCRGEGAVKAYGADGRLLAMKQPPEIGPPSSGEDVADFDAVDAPRLGDAIPTGVKRLKGTGLYPAPFPGEAGEDPSGEVLLSFHGRDGYAGLVHSFRDPDTGETTGSYSGTPAYKLPFAKGPGSNRGEVGLGGGNGRTMAYGFVAGRPVKRLVGTVDGLDMNIRWRAWSENPEVVVWWLVIPTDKVEEDDARRVDLTVHYQDGTKDRDP